MDLFLKERNNKYNFQGSPSRAKLNSFQPKLYPFTFSFEVPLMICLLDGAYMSAGLRRARAGRGAGVNIARRIQFRIGIISNLNSIQ